MKQESMDWMLEDLLDSVSGARKAVASSEDGIARARTKGVEPAEADRLAAIIAGAVALGAGASDFFDAAALEMTLCQYETGWLVLRHRPGVVLAVLADADVDMAVLTSQMDSLLVRLGAHMVTPPRTAEV